MVGTMYRIVLSSTQKQELERVFKRTEDRRLRARCQAVLMAARGFTLMPGRRREIVALLLLIPLSRFAPSYYAALTDTFACQCRRSRRLED